MPTIAKPDLLDPPRDDGNARLVAWVRQAAPYIHAFRGKTFVIAFGLAIMFNIDALHVSQRLYSEPVLRKGTADAAAAQILKTDTLSQNFSQTEQALLVSEPVGWAGYKTWCDGHSASSWCAANGGLATLPARTWRLPTSWPYALMGWLITALATMMGAPFWFDSLTRLVNLRNTGPKPKPSPGQ